MVAEILPFPLSRRLRYVRRQAEMIASMKPEAGNRYLLRQLEQQWDVMERRGVACETIEREIEALGRAIHAALWTAVLTPGDRA